MSLEMKFALGSSQQRGFDVIGDQTPPPEPPPAPMPNFNLLRNFGLILAIGLVAVCAYQLYNDYGR